MTSTAATYDTGASAHPIARCAERLVDAIAAVAGTPAWSMTPDEQRTTLVDLTRAQAQLCELRLRVLASGDNNSIGADTGASSAASWLAHATRQTRTNAAADVRLAAQLDKNFEATRTALAAGLLNEDQARVIIYAVNDLPEDIPAVDRDRAQAFLIAKALVFDSKALRILGRRLFEVIDPDAADEQEGKKLKKEEDEARRTAWFKIRDNGDGTHSGSFKLPTLHAEMLGKVLGALTSPRRLGPAGRTDPDDKKIAYPTLLGRGFMELIENLPTGRLPNCGGNNATIVVTTDLATLRTGLGAATLDTGGKVSAGQARRLACNAGIIPLVLDGDSTSAASNASTPKANASRSPTATRSAPPRTATGHPDGANTTTKSPGPTAAPPPSKTGASTAAGTTTSSTTTPTSKPEPPPDKPDSADANKPDGAQPHSGPASPRSAPLARLSSG